MHRASRNQSLFVVQLSPRGAVHVAKNDMISVRVDIFRKLVHVLLTCRRWRNNGSDAAPAWLDTYRFCGYKDKVIDLLARVTSVSVETVKLV